METSSTTSQPCGWSYIEKWGTTLYKWDVQKIEGELFINIEFFFKYWYFSK